MRKVKTRKTSDFPGKSGGLVCNEYITPVICKYPFWQMTKDNPKAVYACLNFNDAYCPVEIEKQSVCIDGDSAEVIERLLYGNIK